LLKNPVRDEQPAVEPPPVVEPHRLSKKPVRDEQPAVEPPPVVEPHRLSKKPVHDEQPAVEPPPVVKSPVVEGWVRGSGFGSGRSLDREFCWLVEG